MHFLSDCVMDLKQFAKEELPPQTAPDNAPDLHWYLPSRSQRQAWKGWAALDRPYPEKTRGFWAHSSR